MTGRPCQGRDGPRNHVSAAGTFSSSVAIGRVIWNVAPRPSLGVAHKRPRCDESSLFYLHPVVAWTNIGESVKAAVSSGHVGLRSAIHFNPTNRGARNDGTGGIGDRTTDAGTLSLGVCNRGKASENIEKKCEYGSEGGLCPMGDILSPAFHWWSMLL